MGLIFGRKYSIKYLIVKIVNMQVIIETIKMNEGSREIIKKRWKDYILWEENLGIIKSRPGGLETRHQICRETITRARVVILVLEFSFRSGFWES